MVNTLRPRQNGRHFPDDIFKCTFLNENISISIKISIKFVSKGPINNIPTLVQIMACHRPGDKPLSEQMMVSLLAHICVTQPQWVNVVPLPWWRNSTETLFALLALNEWKPSATSGFLSQVTSNAELFSFILTWTHIWTVWLSVVWGTMTPI